MGIEEGEDRTLRRAGTSVSICMMYVGGELVWLEL